MKRSVLLIVAALLSCAIPAVRPATIQTKTKQAPHKSILTQDPKDLPQDCQAVHKRSLNLLQEFDAALPVKDRELAIKSVEDGRKLGRTLPQAYEHVGAGAALTEHYPVAAWASLNAARLSWRAESVTNVGVYLFYLNRFDDAETFLNCARRMAPQSPFPLEALAMIAFKRKTYPLAMSLIEQAVRLMPNDTNVLYTAGIIHYKAGQVAKGRSYLWKAQQRRPGDKTFEEAAKAADPRGENRPPPPQDALAKLTADLFASFDETIRKGEALAAYANRIERLKRSLNPPTYTAEKLKARVTTAKTAIEDSERRFRALKGAELQRHGASLWNQAVFDCVTFYFVVFRAYQDIAWNADPASHLLANAMDVPADRLVEDLYVAKGVPTGVFYLMLRQERLHEFARTYTEAGEEYGRVLDECNNVNANECAKLANRTTWCPKVPPRFSVMAPTVDENINAAAGGLKGAVQLELLYTRTVVGEASDFVSAAVRICRPIPTGQRQDPASVLTPQAVDKNSRQLFKAYIGGFVELRSAFIEISYNELQQDIDSLYNDIDALREEIKQRCEEAEDIEKPIIDKEIEALIAALKESGEFGAGLMFECEIGLGPYKISIKAPDEGFIPVVGLERQIGGFGVKAEGQPGSDRRGVEVNAGAGGGEGVVVDASVKLWGEYGGDRPADYGAEIEGKLGVGVRAGSVGVACYGANANARINARVFAESYAQAMRN